MRTRFPLVTEWVERTNGTNALNARVFFTEMWPVLDSSMETLRQYLESGQHEPGVELPGKTFLATPGFEHLQTGDGPLTHEFEIGGVRERRMVVPYHLWMLQRIARVVRECTATSENAEAVRSWLSSKAISIYGGSFEIQNNIIAKNILGLPETTQQG